MVLFYDGLDFAKLDLGQSLIAGKAYLRFQPEFRLAIGNMNMDMHPLLLTGEEKESDIPLSVKQSDSLAR